MWNAYAKLGRLKKALQSRGLDPEKMSIKELLYTLEKRGMADHEMNNLVWQIIGYLEPPGCTMSHCKHSGGSSASCECGLGRIPGRCKEHREYLKRCKERDAKVRPSTEEEYTEYLRRLRARNVQYVYPTEAELKVMAIPRDRLAVVGAHRNLQFKEMPGELEEKTGVDSAN